MHIESDYSVLDVPRIRTIAMETGYSSVNLYDEVDSTTTRARELLMDGTDPEREQLGELSVYVLASTKAPDAAASPEPGPPLPGPASPQVSWCARTPPQTLSPENYPKTATTG